MSQVTEAQKMQWEIEIQASLAADKERKAEEEERQEMRLHLRGQQVAADKKETARKEALRIYVSEGGSAETFSKLWESGDLYEKILEARTLARIAVGDRGLGQGQKSLSWT